MAAEGDDINSIGRSGDDMKLYLIRIKLAKIKLKMVLTNSVAVMATDYKIAVMLRNVHQRFKDRRLLFATGKAS